MSEQIVDMVWYLLLLQVTWSVRFDPLTSLILLVDMWLIFLVISDVEDLRIVLLQSLIPTPQRSNRSRLGVVIDNTSITLLCSSLFTRMTSGFMSRFSHRTPSHMKTCPWPTALRSIPCFLNGKFDIGLDSHYLSLTPGTLRMIKIRYPFVSSASLIWRNLGPLHVIRGFLSPVREHIRSQSLQFTGTHGTNWETLWLLREVGITLSSVTMPTWFAARWIARSIVTIIFN